MLAYNQFIAENGGNERDALNVALARLGAEANNPNSFGRMAWIEYDKQKPEIGQLVLVYRDIESRQIYATIWSEEDERFADWNAITYWMPLEYPPA